MLDNNKFVADAAHPQMSPNQISSRPSNSLKGSL